MATLQDLLKEKIPAYREEVHELLKERNQEASLSCDESSIDFRSECIQDGSIDVMLIYGPR